MPATISENIKAPLRSRFLILIVALSHPDCRAIVWCNEAKAPHFDESALPHVTKMIRDLLNSSIWRDDFDKEIGVGPAAQRAREVVEGFRFLKEKLPMFIEDFRDFDTPVPLGITVELLELLKAHKPWIDALPPVSRGAPPSRERNATSHLAMKAYELWNGHGLQGQADAFASVVVAWILSEPQSDAAVGRARRRRRRA